MGKQGIVIAIFMVGIIALQGVQVHQQDKMLEANIYFQDKMLSVQGDLLAQLSDSPNKQLATVLGGTNETLGKMVKAMEEESKKPKLADCEQTPVEAALVLSRVTDPTVRQYATRCLGRLPGKEACARLLELAESDPDSNVRSASYNGLKERGYDKLGELLIKHIKTGGKQEKSRASQVLSEVAVKGMEETILKLIQTTGGNDYNSRQIRGNLYRALRNIANPKMCKGLAEMMLHEKDRHQIATIAETLAACAGQKEVPMLLKCLESFVGQEREQGAASNIIKALIKMNDMRCTSVFMTYLEGKSYICRQARDALLNLRDPLAAAAIQNYYDSADDNNKQTIRRHIEQNGYPGLVYDKEKKTLSVVGADEMKSLLAKRSEQIKKLEKFLERGPAAELF